MRRLIRLWLTWFAIVCFVSLPWIGFSTRPQWHRVQWIPFLDPADKVSDFLLNALLFVPFGFLLGWRARSGSALLLSALMAASISISAEATQLFSTRRFPSATDVAAAVLGALLGALTTLYLRRSSKPETWTD